MGTIEKSFIPILDQLLVDRVERCMSQFDDELFACQFGVNASVSTLATSHYLHTDDPIGEACKLHTLKATHDFLAAYQLLRSSMHSQAANAARLGCETAWQNAWFHEEPSRAARWAGGVRVEPGQVRAQLPRLRDQRRALYRELSQLAHPNKQAMVCLAPPAAGVREIDLDVLLPTYDPERIRRMVVLLFYALLLALSDFGVYHLSGLNPGQRAAFGKQEESMREYYELVAKTQLPRELHL